MPNQSLARPCLSEPEPVKITAHLASELCGDAPMLDALLEKRSIYPEWMTRRKERQTLNVNTVTHKGIICPI